MKKLFNYNLGSFYVFISFFGGFLGLAFLFFKIEFNFPIFILGSSFYYVCLTNHDLVVIVFYFCFSYNFFNNFNNLYILPTFTKEMFLISIILGLFLIILFIYLTQHKIIKFYNSFNFNFKKNIIFSLHIFYKYISVVIWFILFFSIIVIIKLFFSYDAISYDIYIYCLSNFLTIIILNSSYILLKHFKFSLFNIVMFFINTIKLRIKKKGYKISFEEIGLIYPYVLISYVVIFMTLSCGLSPKAHEIGSLLYFHQIVHGTIFIIFCLTFMVSLLKDFYQLVFLRYLKKEFLFVNFIFKSSKDNKAKNIKIPIFNKFKYINILLDDIKYLNRNERIFIKSVYVFNIIIFIFMFGLIIFLTGNSLCDFDLIKNKIILVSKKEDINSLGVFYFLNGFIVLFTIVFVILRLKNYKMFSLFKIPFFLFIKFLVLANYILLFIRFIIYGISTGLIVMTVFMFLVLLFWIFYMGMFHLWGLDSMLRWALQRVERVKDIILLFFSGSFFVWWMEFRFDPITNSRVIIGRFIEKHIIKRSIRYFKFLRRKSHLFIIWVSKDIVAFTFYICYIIWGILVGQLSSLVIVECLLNFIPYLLLLKGWIVSFFSINFFLDLEQQKIIYEFLILAVNNKLDFIDFRPRGKEVSRGFLNDILLGPKLELVLSLEEPFDLTKFSFMTETILKDVLKKLLEVKLEDFFSFLDFVYYFFLIIFIFKTFKKIYLKYNLDIFIRNNMEQVKDKILHKYNLINNYILFYWKIFLVSFEKFLNKIINVFYISLPILFNIKLFLSKVLILIFTLILIKLLTPILDNDLYNLIFEILIHRKRDWSILRFFIKLLLSFSCYLFLIVYLVEILRYFLSKKLNIFSSRLIRKLIVRKKEGNRKKGIRRNFVKSKYILTSKVKNKGLGYKTLKDVFTFSSKKRLNLKTALIGFTVFFMYFVVFSISGYILIYW